MSFAQALTYPLKNITSSGVPDSRLDSPLAARELVDEALKIRQAQNKVDAEVYGLVSGQPPYSRALQKKHGQGWRANFPSRVGEAYLMTACIQYWDLVSSPQVRCLIETNVGKDEPERKKNGEIITEEVERINQEDVDLDYMFQQSQHDMVLYRFGPVMWQDPFDYRAKAIPQHHLLVPKNAKSNVSDWPYAIILDYYRVDELFSKIKEEDSAQKVGWNVTEARRAIMESAKSAGEQLSRQTDWLWWAQTIRNNDFWFSNFSKEIEVAWLLIPEFDGSITVKAITLDGTSQWLYTKKGQYKNWNQAVNAFYYDIGDGSHHSVKGLGIKCLKALATFDRLNCQIVDLGFITGGLHFKGTNSTDYDALSVVAHGTFFYHPPNVDLLPVQQSASVMEGPLKAKQDQLNLLTSNLAIYRPQIGMKPGNPPTARQVEYEAENMNIVGRAQINRYYVQLDRFWEERVRRLCAEGITTATQGGRDILRFQERCKKRGVPVEALRDIRSVRASRTLGWGSADARLQTLMRMAQRFPLYNETGRRNLLEDLTSADVGYTNMRRYCPEDGNLEATELDQMAEAYQQLAGVKVGVSPIVSPSQNPAIYANIFLLGAEAAAQSLQQGADRSVVFNFLETIGPAIMQHINRMAGDPTRKQLVSQLQQRWSGLAKLHQQLGMELQRAAQQAQQRQMRQQQQMQAMISEAGLRRQQMMMDQGLRQQKQDQQNELKQQQSDQRLAITQAESDQRLALADAETASKIKLNQQMAQAKAAMQSAQSEPPE